MKINLVLLSPERKSIEWNLGELYSVPPTVQDVSKCVSENIPKTNADAWLFWDSELAAPPIDLLQKLLETKNDVWHAGLKLGMGGQPDFINFVAPTWMLNRDPDACIEATSWRLSLKACLVRSEVLQQLGGPLSIFRTLDAAALELGWRYIRNGVFIRHIPNLISEEIVEKQSILPLEDQLTFIKICYGNKWALWAAMRALLNKRASLFNILFASIKLRKIKPESHPIYKHASGTVKEDNCSKKISVLIPTINRYSYLTVLLSQLRHQTIEPLEILVIDQTPELQRDRQLRDKFSDLPLQWYDLEEPGQCSSRNFGLQKAQGDYILFIDDDDEITANLIEQHLVNMEEHQCLVSNGIANEKNAGRIPYDFTYLRISDVFPTNNSLIKKDILRESGLFDLAYDHGQRADGDLGMRIYLAGEKMVLNPNISILHHHAPQGGLRTHKARVDTYAKSRMSIKARVLPSVSDIYLAKRYFSEIQVQEKLWIEVLGTFSIQGPAWKKAIKAVLSLLALPQTFHQIKIRKKKAEEMLKTYPIIPSFPTH